MRNFQDTFETHEQSFISTFLICMTLPLRTYSTLAQCSIYNIGWRQNLVPSLPNRSKDFIITVKNCAKGDIKIFWYCLVFCLFSLLCSKYFVQYCLPRERFPNFVPISFKVQYFDLNFLKSNKQESCGNVSNSLVLRKSDFRKLLSLVVLLSLPFFEPKYANFMKPE